MPEGDTIHHAANRIRAVLEGRVPEEIRTPQPRHGFDGWPEALAGKAVRSVDAHGKPSSCASREISRSTRTCA